MEMYTLAFFGSLGGPEMLFVGVIALLLFGKRLPEVARSLGKGVTEFKKGLRGIEEDIDVGTYAPKTDNNPRPATKDENVETSAPKFEPPKSEPTGF
jgi:sec-independent protein translocase protein TatA